MGDGYLRKLLVVGATSVIRRARTSTSASASWINSLLERRPARVVTVAMANKTARIAWVVLTRGEIYRRRSWPDQDRGAQGRVLRLGYATYQPSPTAAELRPATSWRWACAGG